VHRVFPSLPFISRILHEKFKFTGSIPEDSGKVVVPFMQVGNYRQGISATLGPSELQPPVCWSVKLLSVYSTTLTFQRRAKVSDPIHHLTILLESCVFNKPVALPSLLRNIIKKDIVIMLPLPPEVTGLIGRIPFDMVLPLALAKLC